MTIGELVDVVRFGLVVASRRPEVEIDPADVWTGYTFLGAGEEERQRAADDVGFVFVQSGGETFSLTIERVGREGG